MADAGENQPQGILDIIDSSTAAGRARRKDEVGQFVRMVLESADPDGTFEAGARAFVQNQNLFTRRKCVTLLSEALGADRAALKRWLRRKSIVGERD